MTIENLKKVIDPLFAVAVFLIVVTITTATWNSMMSGVPLGEFLLGGPSVPPLIIFIFLLGMGTSNQIEKLKKRRQQTHT